MSLFGESFTALRAATGGGFDSRLIALMLNPLGYHMVVAFSYGRSGSYYTSFFLRQHVNMLVHHVLYAD
jgi:hypothetical protein